MRPPPRINTEIESLNTNTNTCTQGAGLFVKKSGCNHLRSGRATSGSEPPKLLTERKETDGEEKK